MVALRMTTTVANREWMGDWNKAERVSLRVGEISATMQLLYESWAPNDRIALTVAMFRLVQEHHSSIHLLFGHNKHASARTLARPAVEAAMRTAWLASTASEDEISGIIKGGDMPTLGVLAKVLSSDSESILKGRGASVLHSLTHGGVAALSAHYLDGEALDRANGVIVACAAFSLALAGSAVAQNLGQEDVATQLADAFPEL